MSHIPSFDAGRLDRTHEPYGRRFLGPLESVLTQSQLKLEGKECRRCALVSSHFDFSKVVGVVAALAVCPKGAAVHVVLAMAAVTVSGR